MKKGLNQIETKADVERASVAALSDEQIDNQMRTTMSEEELENYGN